MSRPAGMSSESEDEDDYCFQTPVGNKYNNEAGSNSARESIQFQANGFQQANSSTPKNECSPQSNNTTPSLPSRMLNSGRSSQRSVDYSSSSDELRMACVQGNLTLVKAILGEGVSVDQILKGGWTPLMFAASRGNFDVVQYLLEKKADPNIHGDMFTALMAACASVHTNEEEVLRCVDVLLGSGANPDLCERHRMTALMFAAKEGKANVLARLLQANIAVDKQDNKGWTALCWAASRGHGGICRRLLEASADPAKTNSQGQSASEIAQAAGHLELADVLERVASNKDARLELSSESTAVSSPQKRNPAIVNEKTETFSDIEMVLSGLDLSHLIPIFQTHKITLECFLRLNEGDLEKIGVHELGTRKKLLSTISQIHKQDWKTSSLPNLSKLPYITLPDSVSLVRNVNKHLRFIHASIGHLKDQIQENPRILELGQEKHNVATLSNLFGESFQNLSNLETEFRLFKSHLEVTYENGVDHKLADAIVTSPTGRRKWRLNFMTSLVVGFASCVSVLYFMRHKSIFWIRR